LIEDFRHYTLIFHIDSPFVIDLNSGIDCHSDVEEEETKDKQISARWNQASCGSLTQYESIGKIPGETLA